MNKITFLENLGPTYRNKRQRQSIKRRVRRMDKIIRTFIEKNKV